MKKKAIIALTPLLFFSLISLVQAQTVDVTNFDDELGSYLGIGAFGGGLVASFIMFFIALGCLGIITRKRPSDLTTTLVAIFVISMCIAFGWFPVWSLVFMVLIIGLLFSRTVLRGIG